LFYIIGSFLEGLKHGHGYFCDTVKGIEYEGSYSNNKRAGYGKEQLKGIHSYHGSFKDGKKHG
jgi:MORN repeat